MQTNLPVEETMARLRAHLHTAHLDSQKSMTQLTMDLGLKSPAETSEYLSGRREMSVELLLRFARATGKPVWWFFGEQPATVSVEAAETALQNVSRIRLYLEAIESEFRAVKGPDASLPHREPPIPLRRETEVVVDFEPYLQRARLILEGELSGEEPSEVSEESVEMIAKGLYSAETGLPLPPRVRRE